MSPEDQQKAIDAWRQSFAVLKEPVRILIVEDNDNDAELAVKALHNFGLDAVRVAHEQEVAERLEEVDPWLVFVDLKLANRSGVDVVKYVRAVKPECKIVILTGQFTRDSDEVLAAFQAGAEVMTSKPLEVSQLEVIFGSPSQWRRTS